jgi:cholesterol oxidase
VMDHRTSAGAEHECTADDIANDYALAIAAIRAATGAAGVHAVAVGLGATTLLMALCNGLEGVQSAVCMQAGLHFEASLASKATAGLHVSGALDRITAVKGGWKRRLMDTALQLVPAGGCPSGPCRHISTLYGSLFHHDNLDEATHNAIEELFSVAPRRLWDHVSLMTRKGIAVNAAGEDVYAPNLGHLRTPITFLHGSENTANPPQGTETTWALLSRLNPELRCEFKLLAGYGDVDALVGRNAPVDVFPLILGHLEAAAPGARGMSV